MVRVGMLFSRPAMLWGVCGCRSWETRCTFLVHGLEQLLVLAASILDVGRGLVGYLVRRFAFARLEGMRVLVCRGECTQSGVP